MVIKRSLGASVAPNPVNTCHIVTVICDELHAALFIGWGSRVASQVEPAGMYIDRQDFKRDEPEAGCTEPEVLCALSSTALANVRDWAKDTGAFYNSDLLARAVVDLIGDWFDAGWKATNLEPAIESLTAYIEEAQRYCAIAEGTHNRVNNAIEAAAAR